jgi:Ca2+-binding RTX toxin-like protein
VTPGFGGASPSVPGSFPPAGGERGLRLEMGAGGENANNGIAALGGGVDEVEAQSFEVVIGTPFADYIQGTEGAEAIYGGGGADVVLGNGGGDTIAGGADGDYCESVAAAITGCEAGAAQRDSGKVSVGFMTPAGATPYAQLYLVGSTGSDSVAASYAPDAVTFQLSAGTFDQSAGDAGGCSFDESSTKATCPLDRPLDSLLLAGMAGNDTISVSGFPETTGIVATGGEGSDSLAGRDGEDILVDGLGTSADTLTALGGDDALAHNDGPDQLLGGDGNDLFLSVSICDGEAVVGGAGRDNSSWARFTGGGVEANLELGQAGMPAGGAAPGCSSGTPDSLQEIEDLEGSNGEDVFYGDGGPNQLLGHKKPDAYFAGAGSDSILANSGDTELGDFDVTIDCGPDTDSALVDRPQFGGDPVPVNCESVSEADPNNFRTVTQLPPPEPPEPEEPPPPPPVDRLAPRTTLAFHPRPLLFTHRNWRRVAFRFASNEPGSRFLCKLDRKPYRGCTSPRAYWIKAGRHAFRVFAIDRAGNRDPTPVVFKFRLRRH